MEENGIDFVFITDHNNDDYRFFEDDRIFPGIEKNTPDGRLLLLGNEIPVISHPNNFEFEHYRWKGEFRKDHLYEIIDPKDAIVWNKFKTGLKLLKNILLYPLTRNITHKWNCLIPIDEWRRLYYQRAKELNVIGGLDLHVKFVYQEKTHGILIPSYKAGFKWVVNIVYSKEKISNKEKLLKSIKDGNLYICLNQNFMQVWAEDEDGIKMVGESVKPGGFISVRLPKKKYISKIFKDCIEVCTTKKSSFRFKLQQSGRYWIEVYEYDFRVFNLFFGFRPVIITNSFRVGDE